MIPDINLIGNASIWIAILISTASLLWLGTTRENPNSPAVSWSRRAGYLNFAAMTIANLGMVYALLTNDFSVSYVAHVGARETPRFFAAVSLWSSLEGSILFWGWILSIYTALCFFCYRRKYPVLMPWVQITLLAIGLFFYWVLAFSANPFHEVTPVPENGPGPNPLLQNHWLMSVHPPLLYLGYVGMSIPFAFGVASLLSGNLSGEWLQITRRWTLTAWVFLSTAIVMGAWWSYAVLGWGGYWAWDPVENASFMPWLTATAFLHSVMVQEKRQMLKLWNLALIFATFLLTILGTFLTRSGVLESVHSFTQSDIGHYFLVFIALVLAFAVGLLVWKGSLFRSEGRLDHPLSRETVFLFNNLLFVCFCFVVFLGTLYPLVVEALRNVKVSVGAPFFNQMTLPLATALVLLMGIGSALPWRRAEKQLLKKLFLPPSVALLLVPAFFCLLGVRKCWLLATLALSAFSLTVMLIEMFKAGLKGFRANPRRYGGFVVHIGVILIALGIGFSGSYKWEREFTLAEGESYRLGDYTLQLERLFGFEEPQRFSVTADIHIYRNERFITQLFPKLNFYSQSREPIGSPAIRSTPLEDLYLTLMAFDHQKGEASFRGMTQPLVSWIWGGCGVIILGVWIALRTPKKEEGAGA